MKRIIVAAVTATALSCSTDITKEDIRISDYKDGKECAVSFTFDDGMKEHCTIVAPELEKRGWRGTFWLCCAWIHDDPQIDTTHMTWQEVVDMDRKGHEMSNHAWSHANLTQVTMEEARAEIEKNDEAIAAHLGKKPVTFCFPYNAYNPETVELAMEGRVGARLKEFWLGGQNSPKEYLEKQIQDALDSGSWIAGMTHGINYGYDCYEDPAEFTDFLDYVKAMEDRIWVGTFCEVAAYVKEAAECKLTVSYEGNKVIVTPELDIDSSLYDMPLTMEINTEGSRIKASQDGKDLKPEYRDGKAYIQFDPYGGNITIR